MRCRKAFQRLAKSQTRPDLSDQDRLREILPCGALHRILCTEDIPDCAPVCRHVQVGVLLWSLPLASEAYARSP